MKQAIVCLTQLFLQFGIAADRCKFSRVLQLTHHPSDNLSSRCDATCVHVLTCPPYHPEVFTKPANTHPIARIAPHGMKNPSMGKSAANRYIHTAGAGAG